ncbi:MAG: hypothetical protein KatS3mg105_2171 [Gemmatales bacterium]|nr:MAG: hypothetical protein KatS3mg105_2171 [Gemmatales bacterium]
MRWTHWLLTSACAVLLAGPALADGKAPGEVTKELLSLGRLKAMDAATAKAQCLDWLKQTGKTDAATLARFEEIWQSQRPVLERVVQSFTLGSAEAARLLREAGDPNIPAPTELPAILTDQKTSAFFRANLGLAYAKKLSQRRVYEESLRALQNIKPAQVVDPASYFFHRAVAEHALMMKDEASRSILAINEDVADAPDRYRMVSLLMLYDMQNWKDKDLGWIARKMKNIERRLDLARGGPQTQKMQKEVVARLDELIKQLENQKKGGG